MRFLPDVSSRKEVYLISEATVAVVLTLVGQVGASSGRALATWARSAANSAGGAVLDQHLQ